METLSLQDMDLRGQTVLVRVDFNVPLHKNGSIADGTRIIETVPTIQYLINQGAKIVLISHLGRPEGKKQLSFSLKPCALYLADLLKVPVFFAEDVLGEVTEKKIRSLKPGEVLLLENLRFYREEEEPEKNRFFASTLASYGNYYINDAFATSHRKHSSTYDLPKYFPEKAAPGFLMEKEIAFLGKLLKKPERPFHAVLGGSKVSTKCGVLCSLLSRVDKLFIGGGMMFTFLKAQGISIGSSLYEETFLPLATEILNDNTKNNKFYLPIDVVITDKIDGTGEHHIVRTDAGIPKEYFGVDIGPDTAVSFLSELKNAHTIFWNGPMGVFEVPAFAKGTEAIAVGLSQIKATKIVGGGDSIAAIQSMGLANGFTHLSTGGGAVLEWIEYGSLPGIDVLVNNKKSQM